MCRSTATGITMMDDGATVADLGNHLQIIASAVHLIERTAEEDAALLALTRCALESVDRVGILVRRMAEFVPDRPPAIVIENRPIVPAPII